MHLEHARCTHHVSRTEHGARRGGSPAAAAVLTSWAETLAGRRCAVVVTAPGTLSSVGRERQVAALDQKGLRKDGHTRGVADAAGHCHQATRVDRRQR